MYVITGATGNTGSVVARRLLAKGEKVRVIGRTAARLQALASEGAEPFMAELTDAVGLAKAFAGARGVYLMIPPSLTSQDYLAYQDRVTAALAQAVEEAGVQYAVTLSSVGADKPEKTGPVVGLQRLEERLNQISGLNVLHLRAGYFMENTLAQVNLIKTLGFAAGPLRADLKIPMIAAHDIGEAAAEALLRLDFTGSQTRELLGQRDLDFREVTQIIGKAIGKPKLSYVWASDDQVRAGMMQVGWSRNSADLILEMSAAMNAGYMRPLEERSAKNTTPTSYETFVAERFVPLFQGRAATAETDL